MQGLDARSRGLPERERATTAKLHPLSCQFRRVKAYSRSSLSAPAIRDPTERARARARWPGNNAANHGKRRSVSARLSSSVRAARERERERENPARKKRLPLPSCPTPRVLFLPSLLRVPCSSPVYRAVSRRNRRVNQPRSRIYPLIEAEISPAGQRYGS